MGEKFTKFFRKVAECKDYQKLEHVDRTIFTYLMCEYDASNNGSIRYGHNYLHRKYGLKGGPGTHGKALIRLSEAGLILVTRKGGLNQGPDLCALTMFNMNAPKKNETYPHPYKSDGRPIRSRWDISIGPGNPMHKSLSKSYSTVTKAKFGRG